MTAVHDNGLSWVAGCTAQRVGDGRASAPDKHRRAFTIVELMATVALIGIVLGIAAFRFQPGPYALWSAQQQLLGDLRLTRSDALTKGDHFRFDITTANTYVEYRMQLVGPTWTPTVPPVRTRTLPTSVTFTSGVGNRFEFDTRGLMLNPGAATVLNLVDANTGHTRAVTVWPSGQVMPQ